MCGNAIRCAAKHLWDFYLADGDSVTVDTLGSAKEIRRVNQGYAVDMGEPIWGTDCTSPVDTELEAAGRRLSAATVSMGNPHAVIFVPNVDAVDLETIGPAVETHVLFPHQTNVEFVEVSDDERLKVRVWERGVGPTLACGTGACASAVVAAKRRFVSRSCTVSLPGGDLHVDWKDDNHVWMTGPAVRVYAGRLEMMRSGLLW